MAEMMWAGRSSQGVDSRVNAFNSSIAFDGRMYKQDIQGSIAHATMLGEQGIISMSDSLELIGGLKEIKYSDMMANQSDRAMTIAVEGMLPNNTLGRAAAKRLRVYKGAEHNNAAQKPVKYEL